MKIVFKKEDEEQIAEISDKESALASIKAVDGKKKPEIKREKAPQEIQLVKPGSTGGSLLKRKINMFIMILIIIFICGGVAVSVLYMNIIKNVSGEKDSFKGNFTSCSASLENYMEVLSMTEKELNSTSEDIKKYDTLYEEKATSLETAQTELQKTKTDLTSTKALLDKTTENLKKATTDLATVTAERTSLQTQVDKLKVDNAKLKSLVDSLQDDLEHCK